MIKKDVIRMAREAGAVVEVGLAPVFYDHEQLYRFAELVAQHKREACANLCEQLPSPILCSGAEKSLWDVATMACAHGIRTQGVISKDEWVKL